MDVGTVNFHDGRLTDCRDEQPARKRRQEHDRNRGNGPSLGNDPRRSGSGPREKDGGDHGPKNDWPGCDRSHKTESHGYAPAKGDDNKRGGHEQISSAKPSREC